MEVYWILFLVIVIIQLVPTPSDSIYRVRLIASFLLMFIYAALRANGFDFKSYENAFYEIQYNYGTPSFQSRMEEGYVLLNVISPSYRFLLVLLSAFTCFTYYWLFRTYVPSKYYWLGFFLLAISGDKMFLFQIAGLRNAIAINILTLSIPLIVHRKIGAYFALTVLAYYFHNSVIFFMPLAYFVATPYKFKKRNMVIWFFIFLFFIGASSSSLIGIASLWINVYFERYSTYMGNAEEMVYQRSILMYVFVLVVVVMSFNLLRRVNLTDTDNVIIKLSFLFFISLILGVLNFRMSQYFAPYLIISCVVFLRRAKTPTFKYGYLAVVCVFLLYSFFFVFMGSSGGSSYEYKSIL